jgi:hypothetical protein
MYLHIYIYTFITQMSSALVTFMSNITLAYFISDIIFSSNGGLMAFFFKSQFCTYRICYCNDCELLSLA